MDPALWELLKTGDNEGSEEVEAIIRLDDPRTKIAGVRIISRFGPIATCRLRRDSILATREEENVRSLKAPRLLGPELEPEGLNARVRLPHAVLPSDVRRPPGLSLTGAGVVIGIIDWGCDFDHPQFKHPDGSTRLLALWDQRGSPPPRARSYYGYGTVHSNRRINRALGSANPYRVLGYHPADADSDGHGAHGTHVMDIAAGNGLGRGLMGVAPEADLIFVHLADRGTGGLANLGDSVRILEALDFVAKVAWPRPWVVNFSVGRHGGPHDGTTLAEMAFDFALQDASNCFLVQSTGNYYGKNIHSSGRLQTGQTRTLSLIVDEADTTPNELEIWYSGGDAFAVRTESPNGVISRWIKLGEQADVLENGRIVGCIYHRPSDPNNWDNNLVFFLYPNAPPGTWKVILQAEQISSNGVFHAWLERDEACPRCQTRFSKFNSDNFYTTGTLANSRIPLVVGAYNAHSPAREVTAFSSAGPTRDHRPKPDLCAPGEGVLAARSSPRGACRSPGMFVRKSGTSMAAPHVTGAVALCLQGARRPLWSHEIRELILNNTEPAPASGRQMLRYGRGYLDVDRVVEAVLALPPRRKIAPVYSYADSEEHPFRSKERTMNGRRDEYFDRLEQVIKGTTSHAASERNLLAEILRASGVTLDFNSIDPDKLYQMVAFNRDGSLPAQIGESFTVLARPGEAPTGSPQAGDVLLRVALGEPGLGHVAVITDPTLWSHKQLANAPFQPESQQPGFYASVVEGGAFPHTHSDRFARRIIDGSGRVPPDQMILRIRPHDDINSNTLFDFLPLNENANPLFEQSANPDIRFVKSSDARIRTGPPRLTFTGQQIPRSNLVEVVQTATNSGRTYVLVNDTLPVGATGLANQWGWTLESNLGSNNASALNWQHLQQEIVRIANNEYNFWNVPNRRYETNSLTFDRQRAYWGRNFTNAELGSVDWQDGPIGTNGRRSGGHAWSAVFISWVVRQAGAGDHFFYSSAHSCYIVWARKNREIAYQNNPFWAYDINAPQAAWPERGDIICKNRGGNNFTLNAMRCDNNHPSHADVVVDVDTTNYRIVTVGGNVDNRVARRIVMLNAQGFVDANANWQIEGATQNSSGSQREYFALIKVRTAQASQQLQAKSSQSHRVPHLPRLRPGALPGSIMENTPEIRTGCSCSEKVDYNADAERMPPVLVDLLLSPYYHPPSANFHQPTSDPSIFKYCAPKPPFVTPAFFFPKSTNKPIEIIEQGLASLGLSKNEIVQFKHKRGFENLTPIAQSFGLAFYELLQRLRFPKKWIINGPPYDKPYNYGGIKPQEFLGPRLLLTVPGHFRELARRTLNATEAFSLENIGWLMMELLRDRIGKETGQFWWIPTLPAFVTKFPQATAALSAQLQHLIIELGLSDPNITKTLFSQKQSAWDASLAGQFWRAETGQKQQLPTGLPFYPQLITIPKPQNFSSELTKITDAWSEVVKRIKETYESRNDLTQDQKYQEMTKELLKSGRANPVPNIFAEVNTGKLQLAYYYPHLVNKPSFANKVKVLISIKSVIEAVFQTIYDLGWNDLLFQNQGSWMFRGTGRSDGTPYQRYQRAQVLSKHAKGISLDLNPNNNPQGEHAAMDPRIVALFDAFGFRWGQCLSTPDPHHFDYMGTPYVPSAEELATEQTIPAYDSYDLQDQNTAPSAPLLISKDSSVPGLTLYVKIPLGNGIPDKTGIFIAHTFDNKKPFDLVVYLHGNKSWYPGKGKDIQQYWDGSKHPFFALREEVNLSGRNVVFVAPSLGDDPQSETGHGSLVRKFDEYVDNVLAAFNSHYLNREVQNPVQFNSIVLAAHSAGGRPMRLIVTSQSSNYAKQVNECWGFDSLYGGVNEWVKWASQTGRKLYTYWYDDKNKTNNTTLKGKPNIFVNKASALPEAYKRMKPEATPHYWVPKVHLLERLQGLTRLGMHLRDREDTLLNPEQNGKYDLWGRLTFDELMHSKLRDLNLSLYNQDMLTDYCLLAIKTIQEKENSAPHSHFSLGGVGFSGKSTLDLIEEIELIFKSSLLSANNIERVRQKIKELNLDIPRIKERLMRFRAFTLKHKLVPTKHDTLKHLMSSDVVASFDAFVEEVLSLTGQNIAYRLSDAFRPLETPNPKAGAGGDHFSYHKTGRAVDLDEGVLPKDSDKSSLRPKWLIKKDPIGQDIYFRLYLLHKSKIAPTDKFIVKLPTNTRSLFIDDSKLSQWNAEWSYVDVTAIADKYGWSRIKAWPGWESKDYLREWWHYEKRYLSGSKRPLNWHESLKMIYTEEQIENKLKQLIKKIGKKDKYRERLKEIGVPENVLAKLFSSANNQEALTQIQDLDNYDDIYSSEDSPSAERENELLGMKFTTAFHWGAKADIAASLGNIVRTAHPELVGKTLEKMTEAERELFQSSWIKVRTELFATRKFLVMFGLPPALGGAEIPFGFVKIKRENYEGLRPDTTYPLYRTERLDKTLQSLYNQGKINITQEELDLFQRIANVETSGFIQTLNTYDAGVVSIGFMQFTLHVGKIQEWIKLDETAFRRFGIELDPVEKYTFTHGPYTNKYPAIKGVPQSRIDELRRNGWAERFYYAALDDDVIIAEVKLAKDYLQRHLKDFKAKLNDNALYEKFFNNYYSNSIYVKALFQESYNNSPAKATGTVKETLHYLKEKNLTAMDDFLAKYKDLLKIRYNGLVEKTANGTSLRL